MHLEDLIEPKYAVRKQSQGNLFHIQFFLGRVVCMELMSRIKDIKKA